LAARSTPSLCSVAQGRLKAEPPAEILTLSKAKGKDLVTHPIVREELEARAGIEPAIEVLQTSALPLGYRATEKTLAKARVRNSGAGDGI
jgi:hypothetical protein